MPCKRALFLDRDGVINKDTGYVYKISDFEFVSGIMPVLRGAIKKDYRIFIITNQAGIARGYYTEKDYEILTRFMLDEFHKEDINIDAVYHCPHHPDGINEYAVRCKCRKPDIGMIMRARQEFDDIDLAQSVLVGDKQSDIDAGKRAGIGRLVYVQDNCNCGRSTITPECITSLQDLVL